MLLKLKVLPRSSSNKVVGMEGDAIKIKIAAPPEKGKANDEVVFFLASLLKVAKSNIAIEGGERSRNKLVRIYGVKKEEVFDKLGLNGEHRR